METNPVKTLMHEHAIIEESMQAAEKLSLLLNNGEVYKTKLIALLDFFRKYSDAYHHQKEEQILFPALLQHPDFKLDEIIDELNEHHSSFREYIQEIEEYISKNQLQEAQKILEQYVNELRDHIAIENDELFVMTENLFSDDELEKMYFLFEDIDRDLGLTEKKNLESIKA